MQSCLFLEMVQFIYCAFYLVIILSFFSTLYVLGFNSLKSQNRIKVLKNIQIFQFKDYLYFMGVLKI